MNYIISSIILLVIIMIIIYILSIDNNMYKLKNKFKEVFRVAGSKDINYINDKDSLILLYFLKSYYNMYDNIMIPKKIFYSKIGDDYIMKDINIIGYKINNNNTIMNKEHTITIKFMPLKNDLFIGQFTLFGINGNYYVENGDSTIDTTINTIDTTIDKKDNIIDNMKDNIIDNMKDKELNQSEINTITVHSSDMIPDIIHLTSDIEEDSIAVTSASIEDEKPVRVMKSNKKNVHFL